MNDETALREAHIGVAMGKNGTGCGARCGVVDMAVRRDNFATTAEAVREGRAIWRNIPGSFIFFLLPSNAGLLAAVFAVELH